MLDEFKTDQLDDEASAAWLKTLPNLRKAVGKMAEAQDIKPLRAAFAPLSEELLVVLKTFGAPSAQPAYKIHCPMAFDDRGAPWLQKDKEIRNPYLGAAMLGCGDIVETISSHRDRERAHE